MRNLIGASALVLLTAMPAAAMDEAQALALLDGEWQNANGVALALKVDAKNRAIVGMYEATRIAGIIRAVEIIANTVTLKTDEGEVVVFIDLKNPESSQVVIGGVGTSFSAQKVR